MGELLCVHVHTDRLESVSESVVAVSDINSHYYSYNAECYLSVTSDTLSSCFCFCRPVFSFPYSILDHCGHKEMWSLYLFVHVVWVSEDSSISDKQNCKNNPAAISSHSIYTQSYQSIWSLDNAGNAFVTFLY